MRGRIGSRRVTFWPASWPTWAWAGVAFTSALSLFAHDLRHEPYYMDESACITQSYVTDLWLAGALDDPGWLERPSLDHPTLGKYLIGLALRAGGQPRPGLADALAWYQDAVSYRFGTLETLVAARWPSVLLGALGCALLFGLGVLAHGRCAGAIAALLLMINPLYHKLARRAMYDVPAEALTLATIALALWAWRRTLAGSWRFVPWLTTALIVGVLGGLAVLAKLNGALGLMTVGALALLALALLPSRVGRGAAAAWGGAWISAGAALATFVVLNPFVTAHPKVPLPPHLARCAGQDLWERLDEVIAHRQTLSRHMQRCFPGAALLTPRERLAAVVAQGFGRHGPLGLLRPGPARRYDRGADRWAWIWGPWVLSGAAWAVGQGQRQLRAGQPPLAWAILLAPLVAWVTIAASIPLAWDRYFLPLQSGSALLAACAAVEAGKSLAHVSPRALLRRRPRLVASGVVLGGLLVLLLLLPRPALRAGSRAVFLSDLTWISASNGWGPVERDLSNGERDAGDGGVISLRGVAYAKGLGVHAGSEIRIVLGGAFATFRSDIGVDDEVGQAGSVTFQVWADGRKLYDSGRMTGGSAVPSITVDVSGCRELRLIVGDGGDGNSFDHADWAGARLVPLRRVREEAAVEPAITDLRLGVNHPGT